MEWLDWTKDFQDETISEDIPAKMQKVEESFTKIKIIATCGMALNLVLMVAFVFSPIHTQGFFVFGSLACVVALAGSRIRADIRLAMYRLMLEWQRNLAAEMRKSEAEDL